jgi:hypothetical protein
MNSLFAYDVQEVMSEVIVPAAADRVVARVNAEYCEPTDDSLH